jgi:polyphosphate glucokinase
LDRQESERMKKNTGTARGSARGRGEFRTLAVDVGGSGIKAMLLDEQGKAIGNRTRVPTPKKATPKAVIGVVRNFAKSLGEFDRVSVGFPGVIKNGMVYSAPNLGKGWGGFELEKTLGKALRRPVRVANDADVQGLGSVSGRGLELVITLGTGFGSVLFVDGSPIHLELGHHPFHKGKTYEDEFGNRALTRKGRKRWNKHLREAIDDLKRVFNYDRLYIGGGNAKLISLDLPADVKITTNTEGLLGGIMLWRESTETHSRAAETNSSAPRTAADRARPIGTASGENGAAATFRPGSKASKSRKTGANGA